MGKLSHDYRSIKETSATVYYEGSFSTVPADAYNKTYSGWIGSQWTGTISVSSASGQVTFYGLEEGEYYPIQGQITCSYKYTVKEQKTTTTTNDKGETITTTYWEDVEKEGSYTDSNFSTTFYTHPGSFSMGATTDSNSSYNIIANVLNTTNIDKWIEHLQKVYHWRYQTWEDYPDSNLQIPTDKIVSAKWFNACMDAMRKVGHTEEQTIKVSGAIEKPPGDIITADLINQLNFSGIN